MKCEYNENLLNYIDQLELEHDRLLLKYVQLMLELEQKERLIKQVADMCDAWHAEIKRAVYGKREW